MEEYIEELIRFNPATATEDDRRALIAKGRALAVNQIATATTTLDDIIERRKSGVDTSTISIPIHIRSEMNIQIANVDKILATQRMTQERYIAAAGSLVKILVSIMI